VSFLLFVLVLLRCCCGAAAVASACAAAVAVAAVVHVAVTTRKGKGHRTCHRPSTSPTSDPAPFYTGRHRTTPDPLLPTNRRSNTFTHTHTQTRTHNSPPRYCPLWALKWEYRARLILHQLKVRDPVPDVVCLQEVQGDHYESFLLPELQKLGYDGLYKQKTRDSMGMQGRVDGCALFYLRDRLSLAEKYVIEFNDAAMTLAKEGTLAPYVHNLPPGANEGAAARRQRTQQALQRLCKDNVAQIAILELRGGSGEKVCISNTHIFWDPEFADVKLWQTWTLASELDRFTSSRGLPLILCGDFNSEPDSSVRVVVVRGGVVVGEGGVGGGAGVGSDFSLKCERSKRARMHRPTKARPRERVDCENARLHSCAHAHKHAYTHTCIHACTRACMLPPPPLTSLSPLLLPPFLPSSLSPPPPPTHTPTGACTVGEPTPQGTRRAPRPCPRHTRGAPARE
jgi:hypothetical protein